MPEMQRSLEEIESIITLEDCERKKEVFRAGYPTRFANGWHPLNLIVIFWG